MKSEYSLKILFVTIFCIFFTPHLFSQQDSAEEYLVPKNVYVGDSAALIYSFSSSIVLPQVSLESDFLKEESGKDIEVKNVSLTKSENFYTLTINFVPWETGTFCFLPFDLAKECGLSSDSLIINLKQQTIASISENLGENSLRPPLAPQTLPGTSYFVWAATIFLFILISALFFVIIRFRFVLEQILQFKEKLRYKKNARLAKRSLKALNSASLLDSDFCSQWQKIMRDYLSVRFGRSFDSVVPSKIEPLINECTGGFLYEIQNFPEESIVESTIEPLVSLFVRTDYIRFANGSLDSRTTPLEENSAALLKGERESIIELSIHCIQNFESEAV